MACPGKGLRFRDDAKCDDEIRLLRRRDSGAHLCRTADPDQLGGLAFAIGAINHGPAHYHSGKTTICAARLIARFSAL